MKIHSPVAHALLRGFAGPGRSGAIVEVAIARADLYLGVARCIVFVFTFTLGALNVALFEAFLVLLQSIVEYHVAPPSVAALWRVHPSLVQYRSRVSLGLYPK